MRNQHIEEEITIELLHPLGQIDDRLCRTQVEDDTEITKDDIRIHQGNLFPRLLADRHCQICRYHRGAHATFGAKDCNDPAQVTSSLLTRRGNSCSRTWACRCQLVDVADRLVEIIGTNRLGEKLTSPCQHGTPEIVGLTLHAHHNHLSSRALTQDRFRGGNPIHIRHVDIHQDHIRMLLPIEGNRLTSGTGFGDHLNIFLKKEQFLELITGIDNIVDDHHTNGATITHG